MDQLTLFYALLLPQCLCFDSEVTKVKTISGEPDVTELCVNATLSTITIIVCRIRTERSGEECRLLYLYSRDFEHSCDSRFSLMTENQTVFLHLTSLTPVDSGNYTCECSHSEGTYTLHMKVTVEEDEDVSSSTQMHIPSILIGPTAVLIIAAVLFGFICRRIRHGVRSRSATSGPSVCEAPGSLDKDDPEDPYTDLQQPASDLYQTISYSDKNRETACLDQQHGRETDPSRTIYENI